MYCRLGPPSWLGIEETSELDLEFSDFKNADITAFYGNYIGVDCISFLNGLTTLTFFLDSCPKFVFFFRHRGDQRVGPRVLGFQERRHHRDEDGAIPLPTDEQRLRLAQAVHEHDCRVRV